MLWTIAVILIVLWSLGLVPSYTTGAYCEGARKGRVQAFDAYMFTDRLI